MTNLSLKLISVKAYICINVIENGCSKYSVAQKCLKIQNGRHHCWNSGFPFSCFKTYSVLCVDEWRITCICGEQNLDNRNLSKFIITLNKMAAMKSKMAEFQKMSVHNCYLHNDQFKCEINFRVRTYFVKASYKWLLQNSVTQKCIKIQNGRRLWFQFPLFTIYTVLNYGNKHANDLSVTFLKSENIRRFYQNCRTWS